MEKRRDDEEMEIDLGRLLFALKKKIWLIILTGLAVAFAAALYTQFLVSPVYTSYSTMLVLTKETTLASVADLQLGSQLTKDYSVLIESRPVLEETIENLGLGMTYRELREMVEITNPEDTRILQLEVNHSDPETAKLLVDELANVSSVYIGDKMEVTPPKIIEDGEIPTEKTSPSMQKNVLVGLLAGVVLACALVCVLEILNDSINTEEDVERYLELSVFAVVPDRETTGKIKNKKNRRRS
ncbi:MAG: YveK family protein [Lachnospiraceae bacterium]